MLFYQRPWIRQPPNSGEQAAPSRESALPLPKLAFQGSHQEHRLYKKIKSATMKAKGGVTDERSDKAGCG